MSDVNAEPKRTAEEAKRFYKEVTHRIRRLARAGRGSDVKVWIIEGCLSPSETWIAGVYSTYEEAVAGLEDNGAVRQKYRNGSLTRRWLDKEGSYTITEYDVD